MKLVYWSSSLLAHLAVFLESFAFVVICVIVGFGFDTSTSGMGLAPMIRFMLTNFFGDTITQTAMNITSATTSAAFAFLLVATLYVASRNGQIFKALLLATASFIVSFSGITSGMFSCFPWESCFTIVDWQNLVFSITIAATPIMTYATAAYTMEKKFGKTLRTANDTLVMKINSSLESAISNLSDVEVLENKASLASKTGKAERKIKRANGRYNTTKEQPSNTTVNSATDIDALLASYKSSN